MMRIRAVSFEKISENPLNLRYPRSIFLADINLSGG